MQIPLISLGFLFGVSICGGAWAGSVTAFMHEEGDQKQIWLHDSDSGAVTPATRGESWSLYPSLSADGRWLAYATGSSPSELAIVVEDRETGVVERWSAPTGMNLHPSLSADGRYLAYSGPLSSGDSIDSRVVVYRVDLAESRRKPYSEETRAGRSVRVHESVRFSVLESDGASHYFPRLSSDGSRIVYQRNEREGKEIVVRDFITEREKVIETAGEAAMSPAFSFDDQWIAYAALSGGNWDIFVQNVMTSERTRVTSDPARDFAPAFTPDGDIVFASDREDGFQLWRAWARKTAESFDVRPFFSGPGTQYSPSLSGDLRYRQRVRPELAGPARSSFGSIVYGNQLYVVGGHQGPEHTYPPESFVDRMEIFDLATGEWRRAARRSVPAQGFELAAFGRYLYAFGGFAYNPDTVPHWRSLNVIERYDIHSDRWEIVGRMPRGRSSNVAVTVGTKVYLIGGWDSTPKAPNDLEGQFHRAIDVFDLETETVSETSHLLPDPLRRAFTGLEHEGKVLLVGGLGVGASHFELLDQVTEFDPATGNWRELDRLPFPTFAPTAAVLGEGLYVFGGMFKTAAWDYRYVNHIYRAPMNVNGTPSGWTNTGRVLRESKGFARAHVLPTGAVAILGGHSYFSGGVDAPVATFEEFEIRPLRRRRLLRSPE